MAPDKNGWIKIADEEPPKDGRSILAWDGTRVREVSWQDSWYGDESDPGWMIANCDEEYGCYVKATHWQPLPPPPESTP